MNELENGTVVKINNDPYMIMSIKHLHMGRGSSSTQARIKNLRTGQVLERNYKPADEFEEAEVEKMPCVSLYQSRGEYWFNEKSNPKNRFNLKVDDLGDSAKFLKPNLDVTAIKFDEKIIGVELPIKVDYKVVEAPPAIRGNTAQGGTKMAVIEGGASISVPLFVNEGDIIRVNTQLGEYTERMEKA